MAWDLKVENPEEICLITIRTINSRLWFVNNRKLDKKILTYLARYQELHNVVLYAFVLMGNHYHMIARFPKANRAKFTKDFNSRFTGILLSTVRNFRGGKIWARPYRTQGLPNPEDVEEKFFYCALNPVHSGLVERLTDYSSYNSFIDAISGKSRKFKYTDWSEFHNRRRTNPRVQVEECTYTHELKFTRLPGFENRTDVEYRREMFARLEQRRQIAIKKRKADDPGFSEASRLNKIRPGEYPKNTKTSMRHSRRPLVLTLCAETCRRYLNWYFSIVDSYRKASKLFRSGVTNVEFPKGTYRPPSTVHLPT